MEIVEVNSSAIAEIGYEDGVLMIRFHAQYKPYYFPNVSEQLFKAFLSAQSKGKFFNEHIKDKYMPLP
ncbi:MAG: KTSC domain-containing protein [Selenomonadaceae bacterium]|nr:KTSC domain-containing protein [Selenomonadaceae bacterium]